MGNTTLSTEFKSGLWVHLETIGNRQLLQHTQTHIQVQKHYAVSDFASFDDRFKNTELYNWRKALPDFTHIVKLYDYEIKEQRFGIQEDQYVYTEKIHRLNQKAKIFSKPEAFLLILDLLTGLDILFETFGIFNIDVFLLGLSESGRGKVWVNQNYAKNTIDQANAIQTESQTNQLVVVNNLVRLIRDKVYNETFIPEIQFPNNMYLKGAIQYLKAVRKDHPLFRVDKIYLDRNHFKEYYETIYKQFTALSQQRPQPTQIFQPTPSYLSTPQAPRPVPVLSLSHEQKQLQRQKSLSLMKVKNEPSETLSSDSNSRSKKPTEASLQLTDFPKEEHHQQQVHHGKIHLKDMIDKQRISAPVINEPHYAHTQFSQSGNHFFQAQQPLRQAVFQERSMIPNPPVNTIPQIVHQPQIFRPTMQEHRAPQINQRPVMLMPQVNQAHEQMKGQQQVLQRKIVEYRPLYSQQRQNIQQIMGPIGNNNQRFGPVPSMSAPQNLHPQVQQIPRQAFYPASQSTPFTVGSRALEQETFHGQKISLNNVIPRNPNLGQVQNEQFINDVELCESVIFDRAQIEQNMAEL